MNRETGETFVDLRVSSVRNASSNTADFLDMRAAFYLEARGDRIQTQLRRL
jgi:hypothetical protein